MKTQPHRPKVLFLTKYPEKGASSRYRVFQYLPYFTRIDARVQSLMGPASFDLIYRQGQGKSKLLYGVLDYLRRLGFLLRHLDAQVIYMQRELFAFGPVWAEQLLKLLGKRLIFDLDDALFINKVNKANPFRWDKAERVRQIIRHADLVVAGNQWIRDESLKLGAAKAVHIDVAEQINARPQVEATSSKSSLHALWLGSATTSKYLKLIEEPLRQLQESSGLRITIVGGDPAHAYAFTAQTIPWSLATETRYLSECDIGLMPLPDEPWSQGKCGGKARTYMASGVVPVVSAIGYNCYLIDEPERGFLCTTPQDWVRAITHLSQHPEAVARIREVNFAYVAEHFDRQRIARQLEDCILQVIA